MKKFYVYIGFSCFLMGLSFAGQKNTSDYSATMGLAAINFNQSSLVDEDENTVDRRKRAHKRKRQLRPRRNGF